MSQGQKGKPEAGHGSLLSYITGFVLSVLLTLTAYFAVVQHRLTHRTTILMIVALALAQLLTQLVFFLHLGKESKPRWNLIVFSFMALVLVIIVFGSLWIMNNLNYHMTLPSETDHEIMHDEGIH